MGSLSVGVVMAVSNIATGVFALIIGVYEIVRICRRYEIPLSDLFPDVYKRQDLYISI